MNKKYTLIFSGLIFIVALGFIFAGFNKKQTPLDPQAPLEVSYSCAEGELKAVFNNVTNVVTLVFADERTLILPQVVSGSGIRYEKDKVVFLGKGENAFVTEDEKNIFNNCIAGSVTSLNTEKKLFTSQDKTFSFSYPKNFVLSGGGVGYTESWQQEATTPGMVLAVVSASRSLYPKTNFSEGIFKVGVSSDPQALTSCLAEASGALLKKTNAVINGISYIKFVYSGAGAGNYYETTSYRKIADGQCYALEYMIHSTNIQNYSPDQGISEYDKKEIVGLFDDIVVSFKILEDKKGL